MLGFLPGADGAGQRRQWVWFSDVHLVGSGSSRDPELTGQHEHGGPGQGAVLAERGHPQLQTAADGRHGALPESRERGIAQRPVQELAGAADHDLGEVQGADHGGQHDAETSSDGREGESAIAALVDLCRELVGAATMPVLGVGVGSPGVIDPSGTVLEAPNRGWFDVPLADRLGTELGLPVHVANAANTAALGEYTYGGATDSLLVLTVGEGVGAGIVLDGALVQGHQHAAGELGHVTALDERDDVDGAPLGRPRPCACGRSGCLETVLSVPALRRRVEGLDDAAARTALAAVGRRLGIVLAPVVSALNLSEVVISGPGELLDGPLRDAALTALRERTMPVISGDLQLRMTSLGEDGALSGAAVLLLSGQLGVW